VSIEHIKVPDLGDASEVEVIELLVSVGQSVEENDSLLVLESDKAAMEIPAPMAGVVKSIAVNLGDQVSTGSEMMSLEVEAGNEAAAEVVEKAVEVPAAAAPAVETTAASSAPVTVEVPDLGTDDEVEIIEIHVSAGDSIAVDDVLITLESDKAAMEVPASHAGVIESLLVAVGDKVKTGSAIAKVLSTAAGAQAEPAKQEAPQASSSAPAPAPAENAAQATAASPTSVTVEVPDLGTDDEVEIIEVHVSAGDSIAVDDMLITLESDKAAMEVPASHGGVIESLLVAVGDKVKTGSAIAKVLSTAAGAQAEPAKQEAPSAPAASSANEKPQSTPAPTATSSGGATSNKKVYAGPAVRKLARELGVDLSLVSGSGAKSRIIKEDVQNFVKSKINAPASVGQAPSVPTVPDIDFSQFGEIEEQKRSKLHRLTAVNMHRNWSAVPHVAQFNDIDVTDLEDFRAELRTEAERKGVKLTFLPFLLKACAKALSEYPQFNVSLHSSGEYIIQKKYIHIGMAVATPAGLVVPVIRDVDKKTIWQLADEVLELADKAKKRKLLAGEMQGACFTISSLGAIGGTGFIPIVNAPEVAILGVGKTDIKPVYMNGEFVPRKIMPVTLSYDHKAVNGVDGGLFATYLEKLLADIRHLAL
jgi:pyruvate dehydrogenase E2 component (dihydrolipoamide acetyltransferase)